MKRLIIFNIAAAAAALLAWTSAHAAETRALGKIEPAKKLIGREIQTTQGQKVGEMKDLIVDLESGRVMYTIVSAGGFLGIGNELTAVPPGAFSSSSDSHLTIKADKEKLTSAPRFTKDHETKIGDTEFAKQVHQHFGQSLGWEGSFNNTHKASELIGMNIKNVSDQNVGDVNNLAIDVQAGRVAFVILGAGEKVYALPPNAFTLGSDKKSLVSSIDKEKLANAPQINNNNWQQLSDARFAARIYQHYGKQPYWEARLTPTGRTEGRVYESDNQTQVRAQAQTEPPITPNPNLNPRSRASRDRDQEKGDLRARREPQPRAGGEFANVEEARRLLGMEVRSARGTELGTLRNIVVDLESGRALYAVVDLQGRGGLKAIAAPSLTLAADDKALRFQGDENKFKQAPDFDPKADLGNTEFATRVYTHFGQQHNWFGASGKFGNAHKTSELFNMKVENVQNQNIGQIQNLMVDLPQARVLYVILSAAPVVGRGDNLFAVPPNAFTPGSDRKTLVTDLDKAKLEGAPRFNKSNLRELANPAKAAEIYRYYGKQAYWSSGQLAPTGRESGNK